MSEFSNLCYLHFERQEQIQFISYIGWAGSPFLGFIPYDYGIFEFDRELYDPLLRPTDYDLKKALEAISLAFEYL